MRKLRQKAYNDSRWKRVKLAYLTKSPLCEQCLKDGRVYGGGPERGMLQIHHKTSPFKNGVIDYNLLLDDSNLETLCGTCHGIRHQEESGYQSPESIINKLDDLLNE